MPVTAPRDTVYALILVRTAVLFVGTSAVCYMPCSVTPIGFSHRSFMYVLYHTVSIRSIAYSLPRVLIYIRVTTERLARKLSALMFDMRLETREMVLV